MLQQTTVQAVIPYYTKWIKTFPTVQSVSRATEQKILKMWQGLGYYSRAKNIKKSADIIMKEYKGAFPKTPQELKKLPGFGPYTVGAVLSIAFDQRQPIIDANVRRVIMRVLAQEGFADTSQDAAILKFLDENMPQKNLRTFNQAMMELGALVCRSRDPQCLRCPVKELCQAYQMGIQEVIPTPKKKPIQTLEVAVGVIKRDNEYYIQQRPTKGLLGDLWEFPGGKIEAGETPVQALHRELMEEMSIEIKSPRPLVKVHHYYTQFKVNLHVFLCEPKTNPALNKRRKWVKKSHFANFPMPSGSVKIVDCILSQLN